MDAKEVGPKFESWFGRTCLSKKTTKEERKERLIACANRACEMMRRELIRKRKPAKKKPAVK